MSARPPGRGAPAHPLRALLGVFSGERGVPLGRHRRDGGPDHVHRDVRGGGARASVFGISDGLVSNTSLVLGIAGAHPGAGVVRLAGLAGLLGGAFSMMAGEYVSVSAQRELLERELDVERQALSRRPDLERRELVRIYENRGVGSDLATRLADELMSTPDLALETHAREELGIDPRHLGSPVAASLSSFVSFALGAFLPLTPFLGGSSGTTAVLVAVAIAGVCAVLVGAGLAAFTRRPVAFSALRSLLLCALAGAATYGIGTAVGVARVG